jgi:tetratricopeptide (TPR) repeat protein
VPIARRLGEYMITLVLGSGGMATVYEAEQDHPRRTVALKILARGLGSPAAKARFRQEAEVLGRLHHHGIAQVFGAGTDDEGRPYFAMELVRGRTLLQHADEQGLDVRGRLLLLARICDATQYAHEHGVIHRDLKPSNIMVDEHGQPKILDFGVARADEPDGAGPRTEPGQLIGTIAYMSPEQASGSAEAVDGRTDVYALGVIGHELLTGRLPLDLRTRSTSEALRAIEHEEPARIGTFDKALRGDLEVIISTALEKNRARRYASPGALAGDIRRFLDELPISARPATAFYYLGKFARRNRPLVGAAAGILAAMLLGLAGTGYGLWRSERRRATAEAVSALLESALGSANPHEVKGVGYTVHQLVDEISRDLHGRLADQPEVEARLRSTIGNAYRLLGELGPAQEHLTAALALRREALPAGHPLVALSLRDLAWVHHDKADYTTAAAMMRGALDIQRRSLPAGDTEVAATMLGLSDVLRHTASFDESATLGWEALRLRRAALGNDHPDTAACLVNLAKLARDRGDFDGSAPLLDEALGIWEKRYGAEHPRIVDALNDRAWLEYQRRDLGAARATLERSLAMGRRLLGEHHPDVANAIYELGVIEGAEGNSAGSEARLREALAIYRIVHGDAHPSVWSTLDALAQLLIRSRHDYAAAEPLAREALEGRRALFGPHAGETALSMDTVARLLKAAGKPEEARSLFNEAIEALRAAYGPNHVYVAISEYNLGLLLQERREWDDAEAALREAHRITRGAVGPEHPDTLLMVTALAQVLNVQGRYDEAESILEPSLRGAAARSVTVRAAAAHEALGNALTGLGRYPEAADSLQSAADTFEAMLGAASTRTLAALGALAEVYEAMGEHDRAIRVRATVADRGEAPRPSNP